MSFSEKLEISIKQYLGHASGSFTLTFVFGFPVKLSGGAFSFFNFICSSAAISLATPRTLKQSPLLGVRSMSIE